MKLLLDKCDTTSRESYHEVAMVVEVGGFQGPSLEVRIVATQLTARTY